MAYTGLLPDGLSTCCLPTWKAAREEVAGWWATTYTQAPNGGTWNPDAWLCGILRSEEEPALLSRGQQAPAAGREQDSPFLKEQQSVTKGARPSPWPCVLGPKPQRPKPLSREARS